MQLQAEIDKEIEKLKYYLEESDELIKIEDLLEIEIINKRSELIHDMLCNIVDQVHKVNIDRGVETARAVRQWKKDTKEKYAPWIHQMQKISQEGERN